MGNNGDGILGGEPSGMDSDGSIKGDDVADRTEGRMIRRDISNSKKFGSLSTKAKILFCLLIPHFNSHGKMNGGPGFIKDEIGPYIDELTLRNIPKLLAEISQKTNVKWFGHEGRLWLHSLNFLTDHQKLSESRLGQDLLPSYSGVAPVELIPEVEVEVEVEVKEEVEAQGRGRVFRKPTAQEVTDYANGIGFTLNGEEFVAHYESNGWMVGRNKMQSWKGAVQTWKHRREKGGFDGAGTYAGSAKGRFGKGASGVTGPVGQVGEAKPKPGQFAEFST